MLIPTGLLAYGSSGRLFHAPFLAAHPGFTLRGAVERHTPRVAADYPGARRYGSVEELLADAEIELVVVNTPNDLHFAHAAQALRAGKHVLLEKPVVPTPAEWRQLTALARQQGRHLLAYQNRRWDSDFALVQEVVQSGRLGRLVEAHFRFDRYRPVLSPKLFKEEPRPGAGILFDLGPHLLDQALALFGRPLASRRTLATHRPGSQVPDFFSLHLRYPDELNVWLTASPLVAAPGPAYVLHGTAGTFTKPRADPQETQLGAGLGPLAPGYGHEPPGQEGHLTLPGPDGAPAAAQVLAAAPGSYLPLFEAVYQTLRHGQPYPITNEQIAWQLEILSSEATSILN